MSFGTAIVVLFAIGCVTWLRSQQLRHGGSTDPRELFNFGRRRSRLGRTLGRDRDFTPSGPTDHERELEREVEKLRERIAVLERIATDDRHGKDLAREIEKLRD
ncbi:hypothetical protein [Novosphingobium sp. 9]|uniref:hypothetical protein n=1 Tax=Novosphingobium sp. 9 TaxID=2025349 RepID=UPI0021B61144|nr:hypothetical protein [Novosphingobium sp. 9]